MALQKALEHVEDYPNATTIETDTSFIVPNEPDVKAIHDKEGSAQPKAQARHLEWFMETGNNSFRRVLPVGTFSTASEGPENSDLATYTPHFAHRVNGKHVL